MKSYLVIFQDEWNNLYYIGEYKKLDDSIKDLNKYFDGITDFRLKKGMLKEYAGTLGPVFDLDLSKYREDLSGSYVRGFILWK